MKRILVPTDFSPNAFSALRVAIDIALRARATIILYHAYNPLERTPIDNEIERTERNKQMEVIILKRLQRLKKKALNSNQDVIISTIIGRTPLVPNLLGFADRNHIDLIVMGTKGASGLKKIFIGSFAANVVKTAAIPVLLIPKNHEPSAFEQIVFASDFHASDAHALLFALQFGRLYHTSVNVVHLVSTDLTQNKKLKAEDDFEGYAYYMQRKFQKYNPKFQLLESQTEQSKIEALYTELDYNLLVLVRRNKTLFQKIFTESLTQSAAMVTRRPIVVMPPLEQPLKIIDENEAVKKDNRSRLSDKIVIKRIKQKVKKES